MELFVDSFDHYATADGPQKYFSNWGAGCAIVGGARTGVGCLEITGAFGPTVFVNQKQALFFGTACFLNILGGEVVRFQDLSSSFDGIQLRVTVQGDGSILLQRGNNPFPFTFGTSAAGVVQAGVYTYIEVYLFVSDSIGAVTVKVNNVIVLALTGLDTNDQANNWVSGVRLMALGGAGAYRHDDVYINDSSGLQNNGFLGPVRLYPALPVSDSAPLAWTPSSGTQHFSLVDEVPPDIADYVSSGGVGAQDQYLYAAAGIPANSQVLGVQHVMSAALDSAGARSVGSCMDGVVAPGQALSTSYIMVKQPYDGPFTLADIAAKRFGPAVTA